MEDELSKRCFTFSVFTQPRPEAATTMGDLGIAAGTACGQVEFAAVARRSLLC
jgi:hypothetical protein